MEVKSDNKAHRYNINDRAEAFTIPLFKLIFGWTELQNLNRGQPNFPGIDLGDYKNRVAVQVTSETTLNKVTGTLQKFIAKEYHRSFDRLVIFMIQGKKDSYSKTVIEGICAGEFRFDPKADIIDLTDLMKFIKELQSQDLERVLNLFQDETGYVENSPIVRELETRSSHYSAPNDAPYEGGFLNLIEIGFPVSLFVADWNFTKKQLGTRKRNDRKLVQEALDQQGLKFAVDWVTIEKQIITFHDLRDDLLPLSKVVDQGTVVELASDEFYENAFYRNKFVELLQKSLQQKLFRLGIIWQHKEREYIFVPLNDKDEQREIEWTDLRTDKRTVYRQIPDLRNKTKVYCHEHFAFFARFYCLNSQWYLAITPDWFYSSNGYNRAWYAIEDKRKYKKLVESNQHVSTHVRFIRSFISVNDPQDKRQMELFPDLSLAYYPYEFLWIKDLLEIKHMPRLLDSDWKPLARSDSDDSESLFS